MNCRLNIQSNRFVIINFLLFMFFPKSLFSFPQSHLNPYRKFVSFNKKCSALQTYCQRSLTMCASGGSRNKLLIIGLGNPGSEYEKTRHNTGFMCLDFLASNWNVEFKLSSKFEVQKEIALKVRTFFSN